MKGDRTLHRTAASDIPTPAARRPTTAVPVAAGCAIALAGLLAYSNSSRVPFVYDGNELIGTAAANQAWPPLALLSGGPRCVGIYSFALDRAWCGGAIWGYHLTNLAIHLAAGLLLYTIVRQTLRSEQLAGRFAARADALALATALLWTVHPLQTQSVTYLYQRFESLAGMLMLLSLVLFLRAQRSPRPWICYLGLLAAWLLAMGTKEIAAMLPFVLAAYDRIFVARTGNELLRRRWPLYGFMLLVLAGGAGYVFANRVGYGQGGVLFVRSVTPFEYARSQPGVILHYLRLVFWPAGQCIDDAWPIARGVGEIALPLAAVAILLAATVWCSFHRPAMAMLGYWFFLILIPTSSVFPIRDLAYEHRMYLPLAAVICAAVLLADAMLARLADRRRRLAGILLATTASLLLAAATWSRNEVYSTEAALWVDTIAKAPHNARAHNNLAGELLERRDFAEAAACGQRAVALRPSYSDAWSNLGLALMELGRADEAILALARAGELDPTSALVQLNLGKALAKTDTAAAVAHFRRATELKPDYWKAHNNYAALIAATAPETAEETYRMVLRNDPTNIDTHCNYALLLARQRRLDEATAHARRAVALQPEYPPAQRVLRRIESLRSAAGVSRHGPG